MACQNAALNITSPDGGSSQINSPICIEPNGALGKVMGTVLPLLFIAAAVLSLFMLLWGGIQYITAGGSEENTQKARAKITYAIIGLVVSMSSLVVFKILSSVLNFKLFA